MISKKYILILMFLLILGKLNAQRNDVRFRADFVDISFVEFVGKVEQFTDARFYYLDNWVQGIRISASGEDISLLETLRGNILPAGLDFYIDEDLKVYIAPVNVISSTLPDYLVKDSPTDTLTTSQAEKELSITEQRYIEGRKAGLRETIVVGSGAGNGDQSRAVVFGKMMDRESAEPLIGATIYVQELEKGAITDVNGHYNIVLIPGKYTVDFSSMGMETGQFYLIVHSGGKLDISLEKSLIPIKEVVIEASRYHNVKGTQMGFERLNYKAVKEIPVVMGEKDILKVIQMLPGVQNVGEGASGFNVRGSAVDQNMIYVRKVPVYNSSHLFGFFSSINPDIIRDFSLYKSSVPANYGGRLASFFDIETRQGNMNKYTARGGISPITGHVAVEGPIVKEKSAFVLSARSSYSNWILKQMEDPALRNSDALFYDLAGTLTFKVNDKNQVKTFAYYSKDKFLLGSTNQYEYSNAGASIDLHHRFSSRVSGDLAAVYGKYAFQTIDKAIDLFAYKHDYSINHSELKADFSWFSLGSHKLTFGGSGIYYWIDRGLVEPYGDLSLRSPLYLGTESAVETALYIADEITLSSRLTVYGGMRFNYFMALGPADVLVYEEGLPKEINNITDTLSFEAGQVAKRYSGFEPRIAINYLLGANNSVKASYNRVRQFLFMLSNTIAVSPVDQWKLCDYNIIPPYVDQISTGYYHDFRGGGISTSLEAYYKWVSNAIEYRDGASFMNNQHIEQETLQGNQRAYGIEFMLKKNVGKLNGWISYGYSRSLMHFESDFPEESINKGMEYPSNYDRPHSLNLVSNYRIDRRLSLSVNVVYTSGRPVTYPVSIYYTDNVEYIHYSERNKYRIPDYFRIDLSVNVEGNLKKRKVGHSFWMLNIYNLTGRDNVYSVYFKNEDGIINGYKLSIFAQPIITLSWNFKFGNYASE